MIKIHRKVEYALIALKHLAAQPEGSLASASEIAQLYKTPSELTARVLQVLARSGYVRSVSGLRGGYQISPNLKDLTLYDLLQTLEGTTDIARCLHDGPQGQCEVFSTCNIITPVQQLNSRLEAFYRGIAVKELLGVTDEVIAKPVAPPSVPLCSPSLQPEAGSNV